MYSIFIRVYNTIECSAHHARPAHIYISIIRSDCAERCVRRPSATLGHHTPAYIHIKYTPSNKQIKNFVVSTCSPSIPAHTCRVRAHFSASALERTCVRTKLLCCLPSNPIAVGSGPGSVYVMLIMSTWLCVCACLPSKWTSRTITVPTNRS